MDQEELCGLLKEFYKRQNRSRSLKKLEKEVADGLALRGVTGQLSFVDFVKACGYDGAFSLAKKIDIPPIVSVRVDVLLEKEARAKDQKRAAMMSLRHILAHGDRSRWILEHWRRNVEVDYFKCGLRVEGMKSIIKIGEAKGVIICLY